MLILLNFSHQCTRFLSVLHCTLPRLWSNCKLFLQAFYWLDSRYSLLPVIYAISYYLEVTDRSLSPLCITNLITEEVVLCKKFIVKLNGVVLIRKCGSVLEISVGYLLFWAMTLN